MMDQLRFARTCRIWAGVAVLACAAATPAAGQDRVDEAIDVIVTEEPQPQMPDDFTLRARVTSITPSEPTDIRWRHGGQGLGGDVTRGVLGEMLAVGQWSQPAPVASLTSGRLPRRLFVNFEAGRPGRRRPGADRNTRVDKAGYSKDVELEVEFRYKDKVVKTLKGYGPEGGTITILIPGYRLTAGKTPADPEFLDELLTVHDYALRRAERVEKLPWAKWPLPKRYAVINNLGGYGHGIGYGIRTTDLATVEAEARTLRQLGVNGLRGPNELLLKMIAEGKGFAKDFNRSMITDVMNYPVPRYREGRYEQDDAGCPYGPAVAKLTEEGIQESLKALQMPVPEVWGLTVDEIGVVVDRSAQGKRHLAVCPRCAEGFREHLQGLGLKPAEFGQGDWAEVTPLDLFGPPRARRAEPATRPSSEPATKPSRYQEPDLTDPHTALRGYWTMRFLLHSSARLFTPLRDAIERANEAKRQALAAGAADTPAANQPWLYSYALRGNNFLMKGHSLDFFDFYRLADNGFVYETSNRGPRIWGWDSYLCDVGRVVSAKMNKRFGIYIKPHRGAPVQRALSAVSRNVRMIYWYVYGPDYAKGDSFSENPEAMTLTSKAAHLIGKTEDVLYGSSWVKPAEVAIVKPFTSLIWMRMTDSLPERMAAWENAKWIYTALTHAHVPVDPLDEEMLTSEDLSQYKIIYVNGPNITRAAAEALARWVQAGGTLYTSGWGCARDEANRPLKALEPVFGLEGRNDPEMYYTVSLYGAGRIESYSDPRKVIAPVPDGAEIVGQLPLKGSFKPVVGREVLKPAPGTEVLVRFKDGSPAVTRRKYGKGQAYVVGFFPGLEYSAAVRTDQFNMARDFDVARRGYVAEPALALVKPVVEASEATVEGVLLKNDETGKQAVTLMNWAYRVTAHRKTGKRTRVVVGIVPCKDLKVSIRGAGDVKKVTSAMLGKSLPLTKANDLLTVTLPSLDEGDVLLLE